MVLRISRPDELVLRAPTGQFSPRDAHAARLAPLPTAACPVTGYEVIEPLAREAGEEVPADLNKAEASKKIDELQSETGRGQG